MAPSLKAYRRRRLCYYIASLEEAAHVLTTSGQEYCYTVHFLQNFEYIPEVRSERAAAHFILFNVGYTLSIV